MIERSKGLETLQDEVTTLHKGVPYYSQSLNALDKEGNIDKFWFRRACGITCAKMVIDYFDPSHSKSVVELAEEGQLAGGYSQSGWRHDYFISLFKSHGLDAFRKEKMEYLEGVKEMAGYVENGGLVIASCIVPFMNEMDYHMILLTGVKWKDDRRDDPLGFYYSDPDSLYPEKAKDRYAGTETFGRYWRNMAIFVGDKTIQEVTQPSPNTQAL